MRHRERDVCVCVHTSVCSMYVGTHANYLVITAETLHNQFLLLSLCEGIVLYALHTSTLINNAFNHFYSEIKTRICRSFLWKTAGGSREQLKLHKTSHYLSFSYFCNFLTYFWL